MQSNHIAWLAGTLLLCVGPALAAPSSADKTFAMRAAQGGLAEVQDGQLAAQRGASPQVKQFGQRMVTDHSQANQDLQQIAEQEGLTLPTQPSTTQQAQSRRLTGLSGSNFDRDYVRQAVQAHQQTVALFSGEAKNGRDPALKAFAQKNLPIIRQHLQLARQLSTQG